MELCFGVQSDDGCDDGSTSVTSRGKCFRTSIQPCLKCSSVASGEDEGLI